MMRHSYPPRDDTPVIELHYWRKHPIFTAEWNSSNAQKAVRRRAIDRKLRGVEILPEMEAGAILSLPAGNGL
jgi:hypothetical protein